MLAPVRVLSQAEFDAWVQSQTGTVSDDPAVRGELLAQQFGCLACHSSDGSQMAGPTWLGVFGSTELLDDGSSVLVDGEYLIKSIREPGFQIVSDYQNIMPENIGANLTDEQLADVIAFIESLK